MSATLAYPVRTPQWVLTYAGVNISGDISGMVREIVYTDRLSGAAGEIEVELEDRDKLWQGPWYPQEGDLTNLNLGYANEALLPCGDFQVDDFGTHVPSRHFSPPLPGRLHNSRDADTKLGRFREPDVGADSEHYRNQIQSHFGHGNRIGECVLRQSDPVARKRP